MKTAKYPLLAMLVLLAGCSTTQHHWGNYSGGLYAYYKNPTPDEQRALQEELVRIFEAVEERGAKPPPGLYAEYGTFMLQQGDYQGAAQYYQKEKQAWPDATRYMDALISAMGRQSMRQSEQGE